MYEGIYYYHHIISGIDINNRKKYRKTIITLCISDVVKKPENFSIFFAEIR